MIENRDRVLLVDIGNTNLKWCWMDHPRRLHRTPHAGHSAEELAQRTWGKGPRPARVVMANVASPRWADRLADWMERRWRLRVERLVSPNRALGVTNAYAEPERLGVDRWLTLIAVHRQGLSPACIVDCGTATTVDAIDAEGHHLGGLILPGRRLMQEGLLRGTWIDEQTGDAPQGTLGLDTGSAIRLAPLVATAGMVEQVMADLERRLGGTPRLILTGSDAPALAARLDRPFLLRPELVFDGLVLAAGGAS